MIAVRLLQHRADDGARRLILAGTGMTHLGSAEGRGAMPRAAADTDRPTDPMRMVLDGVTGRKPDAGKTGQQSERIYKGASQALVPPGAPLTSPDFAQDGSEEPFALPLRNPLAIAAADTFEVRAL